MSSALLVAACAVTAALLPVVVLLAVALLRRLRDQLRSIEPSDARASFSASVIVLGDIGHSPRTANHAHSLGRMVGPGKRCRAVHIIAEGETSSLNNVLQELFTSPAAPTEMRLHRLDEPPAMLSSPLIPRWIGKVLKVLYQSYMLLIALSLRAPRTDVAILQLPPSIPTLPLCLLFFKLQGTGLILDWHNFGFTLLALTTGERHPLTRMSAACERRLGRYADANICVTRAMRSVLESWGVRASVFYDRPPRHFRRSSEADAHTLFFKYGLLSDDIARGGSLLLPRRSNWSQEGGADRPGVSTLITEESFQARSRDSNGGVAQRHRSKSYLRREGRPAVVVSSTSWTKDEDFSILLDAVTIYDRSLEAASNQGQRFPDLLVVITGKGPEKPMYESKLRAMELKHAKFVLAWLDAEDYPKLLGAADLGVCLHKSSSGLDLPMKVVDMFGCGLPVCAVGYNCIHELVEDGVNGKIFEDADGLATLLQQLLSDFPSPLPSMRRLQEGVMKTSARRWDDEWDAVVAGIVRELV